MKTPDSEAMFKLLWEIAYSGRRSLLEKLDDARVLLSGDTKEQPEIPPNYDTPQTMTTGAWGKGEY